jgi:transcriptional regulator GlxA family with amidase domain
LKIAPTAIANAEKRFIDNGKIMTSGGISAGIDLSLHIVEKIYGKSVREETARYMEYGNWR